MREGRPLSLLVRNLRYTTSPDRVRKFFEQFGEVRDVYLPLDYYTKLPRGFGFVEFSRDEDAEAALEALSRHATLDGTEISVTIAQQGRKSPDTMRHRDHTSGRGDHRRGHSRSVSPDRRRGARHYDRYSRSRSVDKRRNGSYDRSRRHRGSPERNRYRHRGRSPEERREGDYHRRGDPRVRGVSRSRSFDQGRRNGPPEDRRPRRPSYQEEQSRNRDVPAGRSGSRSPIAHMHDDIQRRSRSLDH